MNREERQARDRAAVALTGPFRRRHGRRPWEVFDQAQEACEKLTVSQLIEGTLPTAKAWARASVLLNERRKRTLR